MKKFKVIVAKYTHEEGGYKQVYEADAEVSSGLASSIIDISMLEEAFNSENIDGFKYEGETIFSLYEFAPAVWSLARDIENSRDPWLYKMDGKWTKAYRGRTLGYNDIFVIVK